MDVGGLCMFGYSIVQERISDAEVEIFAEMKCVAGKGSQNSLDPPLSTASESIASEGYHTAILGRIMEFLVVLRYELVRGWVRRAYMIQQSTLTTQYDLHYFEPSRVHGLFLHANATMQQSS